MTTADGVTDDEGVAFLEVQYGMSAAMWTEVRLRVTITTASGATEGDSESTFWLPILAADIADTAVQPPGASSPDGPYGTNADCANPN